MDMCLLCLELKNETSDGIKVTSEQWKDQAMDKIIEKHFWVIVSVHQRIS